MSLLKSIVRALVEALARQSATRPHANAGGDGGSQPLPAELETLPSRGRSPRPRHSPREARGTKIRAWVDDWREVPYQMGGTSREGVDCSGFVRAMYRDVFDCRLPRASREQATQGRQIGRNALEPGDLVFFKINERTRHVGAYVGNGEFGHASTSKGPVVSRLDSEYWASRYWTARRVL